MEHIANVLEQKIRHKAMSNNFMGMDLARNGQDAFGIKLYHLTILILTQYRQEIQQSTNILLMLVRSSATLCCIRIQIIGELFNDGESSSWIEIKHVSITLTQLRPCLFIVDHARILGSKSSLHICRRTLHVAKHEHSRPFRDSDSCSQLTDRQRNGLVAITNCISHFIQCLHGLLIIRIVELAIASGNHYLVIFKYRMVLKHNRKRLDAINSVQYPESMF